MPNNTRREMYIKLAVGVRKIKIRELAEMLFSVNIIQQFSHLSYCDM